MLFDAATADRARFAEPFDVCVVGAGPAGVTLARTLAARGLQVALMEAGDLDFSDESQAFYRGESVGLSSYPTDESRLRYFGGTSGHWEGKCRTLDAEDFQARPWVPMSGWPIGRADLDPFQAEAAAILDLDSPTEPPDIAIRQAEARFRQFNWRWSPPTRFGDKYRDEIIASGPIAFCIKANLIDLQMSDDLGSITSALFRSYDPGDPGFTVRARAFAICLGGAENARALLNCRSQMPQGIGNGHDLVGRFFCDRPTVFTSDLLLASPMGTEPDYFAPMPAFARAEELANFVISVEPRRVPAHGLDGALLYSAYCATPAVTRLIEHLRGKVTCYFGGVSEFNVRFDPKQNPLARVGLTLEQTLNPDSRVMLGDEKDAFGLNRIRIDWRLTDRDYRTMQMANIAFGAHVAEQDIGRLRLRDWLMEPAPVLPEIGGEHGMIDGRQHMCTTRMSDDPRTGVVDAACRVHGVSNLYIGGSSVFGTPGYAKPTFTIVQLALRLGQHIGLTLAT